MRACFSKPLLWKVECGLPAPARWASPHAIRWASPMPKSCAAIARTH